LTGASGFIGRFLVEECLGKGYEVYATIRESSKIGHLSGLNVRFIVADLSRQDALVEMFKGLPAVDYVIHNAGLTKAFDPNDFIDVNVNLTKNLVNAMTICGVAPAKLLYVSSLAAYGPGNQHGSEPVTNKSIPRPVTAYGTSKLMAERFIMEQKHLPWIIVRPTAVYGPGERDIYQAIRLINSRFEFYIGSEAQHLTFVYVRDLVSAMLNLLESNISHKAYFVSDGNLYSKKNLGQYVSNELHKKVLHITVPLPLVKVIAHVTEKYSKTISKKAPALNVEKLNELTAKNWNCDVEPLFNDLGFRPRYNLEKGIHETIKWYKKEGWLN